jgi:spore germination cell wall hydrolase CwlJ-like protein
LRLRHFLSMLSFVAVALVCMPSFADRGEKIVSPLQPLPVPEVTISKEVLTPQQQVDNARNTVKLDQDYVLNLKASDPTMYCLAQNAFFEARAENLQNKVAVTEVVKNRLDSGKYAGTLCAVVRQRNLGVCQFSWVCQRLGNVPIRNGDGTIRPEIYQQWYDSVLAAVIVSNRLADPVVPGALNFYAQRVVRPSWADKFKRIATIGGHTFLKPRE